MKTPAYKRNRFSVAVSLWIAMTFASLLGISQAQAKDITAKRVALIIGNADYATLPLKNSINDAKQMAMTLKGLGFETTFKENANLSTTLEALRAFTRDARKSDVRLFYYAGHGLQMRGRNYLVPIGATLQGEEDVLSGTADATGLIDRIVNIKNGINIVILDTCRQYPVPNIRDLRAAASTGLAKTYVPQGTLVAFATGPGGTASDGEQNATNSVYTKHLLRLISTPGLPIDQLFKQVRTEVVEETKGAQKPWDNINMIGNFCFRANNNGQCS